MADLLYDPGAEQSILAYARALEGRTFGEVARAHSPQAAARFGDPRRKGGLGNLLEEAYFGYRANSDRRADFYQAGVELKVTPYEVTQKGALRAGERLVLTMIDYDGPVEADLYSSHLWQKCARLLLVWYKRDRLVEGGLDYRIDRVVLFTPSPADRVILEEDYRAIMEKVRGGCAHLLSESDTLYLGACTKGATAQKSIVPQRHGDGTPARRRAFWLKQSYMTALVNELMGRDVGERLLTDPALLAGGSFQDYLVGTIARFRNQTDQELCRHFGRPYNGNKAQWIDLAYRMLGLRSNRAAELQRADITVKALRIEADGRLRESSSLPTTSLMALLDEAWEESELCRYFQEKRFLFVVYQKTGSVYRSKGAFLWNMPYDDLHTTVRAGWQQVRDTVARGVQLTVCTGPDGRITVQNDLLKKSAGQIVHLRPHSRKRHYVLSGGEVVGEGGPADSEPLPDARRMQKQSFWLNSDYLLGQVQPGLLGAGE